MAKEPKAARREMDEFKTDSETRMAATEESNVVEQLEETRTAPVAQTHRPAERSTMAMDGEWLVPDRATVVAKLKAIKEFQEVCHAELVEGHDYGVVPGTGKPTLLKPGAEKIAKLLGLADTYEIVEKVEDWKGGFFSYIVRCILTDIQSGILISTGIGACNSLESRYRWRYLKPTCPHCGAEAIRKSKDEWGGGWYCNKRENGCGSKFSPDDKRITEQKVGKIENDDIFSQVNTLLKMAKKRSLVDAALSAGRLSDIFTQDLEDNARDDTRPKSEGANSDERHGSIGWFTAECAKRGLKATPEKRLSDLVIELAGPTSRDLLRHGDYGTVLAMLDEVAAKRR